MNEHRIVWTAPAPLWGRFGEADEAGAILARFGAPDQARPAILRFDSDDFMDRVLAVLARSPRQLGELVARPETWRTPLADTQSLLAPRPLPRQARALERLRLARGPAEGVQTVKQELAAKVNAVERTLALKLFHPAHQRHYLVAANLVCARAGFPDRAIATGGREQVGIVLRRMLPPSPAIAGADRVEFAFMKDAQGVRWQRVLPAGTAGDEAQLVDGEELLPLFPLNFAADDGQPRRIHAGVVPVGRREEYMSTRMQQAATPPGGSAGVAATPSPIAERKEQFRRDVTEPWKNVVRSAASAAARASVVVNSDDDRDPIGEVRRANQNAQMQSWLALLDFADFLAHHLEPVWRKVNDPAGVTLANGQLALYDWLASPGTRASGAWEGLSGTATHTLAQALKEVVDSRRTLEQTTRIYPDAPGDGLAWPAFSYLLAGLRGAGRSWTLAGLHQHPDLAGVQPATGKELDDAGDPAVPSGAPPAMVAAEAAAALVDKVVQLVVNALDTSAPAAATPPLPFAAKLRDALATTGDDEGWFVLRCVYLRCDCGLLQPAVLSAPTVRFQLASFFDPDAPARPIRIALPLDTTPAGLRKFDKNAALMLSDVLCGQVQRAKGLGLIDLVLSVLPWPLHKDLDIGGLGTCEKGGNSIGMICSLSIPIVTICALILLMIIVSLLDFIFRWMPWLVVCLPIPKGLKAKVPGASP